MTAEGKSVATIFIECNDEEDFLSRNLLVTGTGLAKVWADEIAKMVEHKWSDDYLGMTAHEIQ